MKRNDHIFPADRLKKVLHRYEQSRRENHDDYFDVDELEAITDHYLLKKKIKNALDAVAFGQKIHPDSIVLRIKQVHILLVTDENEKAMSLIEILLLIEPHNPDLLFLKGEIFLSQGKTEEARGLFDKVVENESNNSEIYLDIAYIYIEKMDFETATSFLEKGFNIHPQNTDIWFELAFCYEQTGDRQAAIGIYNNILDENPYSNEAWFNMGQLLFLEEDYEKSAEAFDFAYITGSNDHGALLQKAHSFFQCERYQKAIEAYQEYAELTEYTPFSYVFIGECHEKMDNFDSAKEMYRNALEKDPQNADAWTGLCICSMEQEHFQESLTYIKEAIKIDSNVSEYWIYMAEAYVNLGKNEDALSCYLHSLSINPEQLDTFVAIGNLYLDAENFPKALLYYQKAQLLKKDTDGLSIFFAITYFKLNQKEEALKFLIDAIAEDQKLQDLFFDFCPEAKEDPLFYEL